MSFTKTLNFIHQACRTVGTVKRVVVTSSVAAITDDFDTPHKSDIKEIYDEKDWTDTSRTGLPAYFKSKVFVKLMTNIKITLTSSPPVYIVVLMYLHPRIIFVSLPVRVTNTVKIPLMHGKFHKAKNNIHRKLGKRK